MTQRTVGLNTALVAIVVAFIAGAVGAWTLDQYVGNRGATGLALSQQLATTGLCANGLKLLHAGDSGKATRLLEQQLDLSLDHAMELIGEKAALLPGSPNLIDSVRRASDYYAATAQADKKQHADDVLAALDASKR